MIPDGYYRNLRATFLHIDAAACEPAMLRSIKPAPHVEEDFAARVTIEGAICWRDPGAKRHSPRADFAQHERK